jgi:hypothetical protein
MKANDASAGVPDETNFASASISSGTRGFTSALFGTLAALGLFILLSDSPSNGVGKLVLVVITLALAAFAVRAYRVGLVATRRGVIVRKYAHTELIPWADIASFAVIHNGYFIGYVTLDGRIRTLMFFATLSERTADSVVRQLQSLQAHHLNDTC